MRLTILAILSVASLTLASCVNNTETAQRRPVPPKGSDDSSMPWSQAGQSTGNNAFGGLLEGR